jgi:ADP-dependent NAD(P)H-hydrate dehydratase / NAD(P)H-hydrate epimerase
MKLLTASQIKAVDALTIQEEKIVSVDLMERAARVFAAWFQNKFPASEQVLIFCGPGNNGGDGLAVARLLHAHGYNLHVYIVGDTSKASADFKTNLEQLPEQVTISNIQSDSDLPTIVNTPFIIDALFGTGLNRPVTGLYAQVIERINASGTCITAIDMPTGLYTDSQTPDEGAIIKADFTISFEMPKLAFLLPQHEQYVGEWYILPINLSKKAIAHTSSNLFYTTHQDVCLLLKSRKRFSHKGIYGHALLLAGGIGKMGAAVLAARACLRGGVGLLTVQVPSVGYTVLQTSVPEAMTLTDSNEKYLSELPANLEKYNVIGVGPGIGTEKCSNSAIHQLLATSTHALVIDADAINIIAASDRLKKLLPSDQVIFTPHPKEFERLVGKTKSDYDRLAKLKGFCSEYGCYVVLKGNNTAIGTPDGNIYFNSTGNPGMATGGTGDVLTGIITALVAQQYTLKEACIIGVYVHGLAGDLALNTVGAIAMTASDLIDHLPQAFLSLSRS